MPNKNYMAGRRIEYRAMKELEAGGWKVIRAAGSHGEFDLVAYRVRDACAGIEVKFIQCKRDKKTRGHIEENYCKSINEFGGCSDLVKAEMWVWEHRKGWKKS